MTMQPAPSFKPKLFNVPQALNQALTFHHQGRLPDAERLYAAILEVRPDHFDALQMLGLIKLSRGQLTEALRLVAAALKGRPNSPQALLNHGLVLESLDRREEALASFDDAIKYKSKFAEAHNNRAAVLLSLGRDEEAIEACERALAIKPDYADALSNLGNALRTVGRIDEAMKCLDRALALRPNNPKAHNNRGTVFDAKKDAAKALECYDRALALDPNYGEALSNRGRALRGLGRHDEGLESLNRAIELNPSFAYAYCNRAALLSDLNRCKEATANYEQVNLAAKTLVPLSKFGACISELPILYRDESEIATQRAAYAQRLDLLREEVNVMADLSDLVSGVGAILPFYLAYQGQNDRELQSLFGSILCRIMATRYPAADMPAPPADDEPVRVGIVSGFFRLHSNWKIPIKGWLSQMDRRRFKFYGYHTGRERDRETDAAAALCERFVEGPMPTKKWREQILADAPHILIYPEFGMDDVSARLATQRLAPVQCNSWGHPDTSGLPTMDYYLSSDLMEPPDAQDHYSERIVRLPNLSIYYEPPEIAPLQVTRADLGLRDDATVFWCGQSTFKYLPQFDSVFPRIAREAGNCQFAFIEYQGARPVADLFRERIDRAFSAFGMKANDYCAMLPRLTQSKFAAAIGQCDIVLDSIGWSGCNSTLEGLVHDLPVVTMPGKLMRGRHSAAIFQMMGITETIAPDIDSFITTAARLARDPAWRASLKEKIAANKRRLYRDRACIAYLEDFIDRVARGR